MRERLSDEIGPTAGMMNGNLFQWVDQCPASRAHHFGIENLGDDAHHQRAADVKVSEAICGGSNGWS